MSELARTPGEPLAILGCRLHGRREPALRQRAIWSYCAIFLTALGLLYVEVLSVRIIAIVLDANVIYYVISLAMLGIGSAGAVAALTRPASDPRRDAGRIGWLALAASGAILVLFLGISAWMASANESLDAAVREASGSDIPVWEVIRNAYLRTYKWQLIGGTFLVGTLMFVPYFLLGMVLVLMFRSADGEAIPRMYASDLAGAGIGAVLAIIALDHWDLASSAVLAITLPLLAAISLAIAAGKPRRLYGLGGVGVAGILVFAFCPVERYLEPTPHLPTLARTLFMYEGYEAKELWHTWTSYGRVAAVEMRSPDDPYTRTVMAHGNGEGHARVFPNDGDLDRQPVPIRIRYAVRLALAGCSAEQVLVLLAGAGADMVLVDRYTRGNARITGVELVPEVFEWPSRQERFGLAEFFEKPNVRMVGAEGREFLARDENRYDCILFSWTGASRGYFTGVSASAPGYLMTREGLSQILSHLAPGGQVTLLARDSVRLMVTLAELLRERGKTSVEDSMILASRHPPENDREILLVPRDDVHFLMVKPDGFSAEDVSRMKEICRESGLHLIHSPGREPDAQSLVRRALNHPEPYELLNSVLWPLGAGIFPADDDRPFADDPFPRRAYLTADFWLGGRNKDFPGRIRRIWKLRLFHVIGVFGIVCASIALILVPLVISYRRRTIPRSVGAANHLFYFGCLGAGFMLIEMGFIQKLRLLVGHPGHTIAIVLASVILFSGTGSFSSGRLFRSGLLTFRRTALSAALATVGVLCLVELLMPVMVGLPRLVKLVLAFALPAVPAFAMGQLFPQGLAALTRVQQLIPLAMGINAMTGTVAAGLGVALAPIIGFRAIIFLGCVVYGVVAFMPHGRRTRRPDEPTTAGVETKTETESETETEKDIVLA